MQALIVERMIFVFVSGVTINPHVMGVVESLK